MVETLHLSMYTIVKIIKRKRRKKYGAKTMFQTIGLARCHYI